MRVIAGKFKGKRLTSPPENAPVRPTTDRIKETMFNILGSLNAVEGERVLDLFCGSGALGIEALSRGAAEAIFIDSDYHIAQLARQNLNHVSAQNYSVFNADYSLALKKLAGQKFGLIILDPPYKKGIEKKALELIEKFDLLKDGGIIMLELSAETPAPKLDGDYTADIRNMGTISVCFYKKTQGERE